MEPKGKFEFNQVMTSYYQSVKTSSGGCLMAVCRGKVNICITVIIVMSCLNHESVWCNIDSWFKLVMFFYP